MVITSSSAPLGSGRSSFAGKPSGVTGRVGVRLIGDDKLRLNFMRMKRLPMEGVSRILDMLVSEFLVSLNVFAPKNTGRYVSSWRVKINMPTRKVVGPMGTLPGRPTVGGGVSKPIEASKLAYMLEFTGAAPHQIGPRVKEKILFEFADGGLHITSKPVNHPGFKPIPHIRLAMADARRKAKGIAYAVASEYMEVPRWSRAMQDAARAAGYTGPIPPRQTGRNRADKNANIGRGTKGNFKAKLSRPGGLTGTKITRRGTTRAVGTNLNFGARKGAKGPRQMATRFQTIGFN